MMSNENTLRKRTVSRVLDETLITEITLQADGRVYVFGTSLQVLEILEALDPSSERLQTMLEHVRGGTS